MKVLHLMRTWAMGGAQAITLSLFRRLPDLGIEQLFLPYAANRSADDEFLSEALRFGMPVTDARLQWNGLSDWRHCRQLIRETVARERIDVIHTHDNQSNTLVGIGRGLGAQVATAYGWWDLNFKVKVYYAIERHLALPRFDRVTTVSEHMKRKIVAGGTPADRVAVIHTGLEPEAFRLHSDRAGIRATFGIAPDALVVGTVSRLSPEKGQRFLLEAAAAALTQVPNLLVLLVGKGPEREALERQAERLGIKNRVRFAGYVEDTSLALQAIDIFILSSILDEGFPTCILEAQAAALPVIATDVGGTGETIEVGSTGLLVSPGDAAALARTIVPLATDHELRRAMGDRGRSRAMREFTVDRMVGEMADAYQEACNRNRRARAHV